MIKANDYSIEPNKEAKVSKRGLEELSLFSQAKGCAGERREQHSQGEELKDSR